MRDLENRHLLSSYHVCRGKVRHFTRWCYDDVTIVLWWWYDDVMV